MHSRCPQCGPTHPLTACGVTTLCCPPPGAAGNPNPNTRRRAAMASTRSTTWPRRCRWWDARAARRSTPPGWPSSSPSDPSSTATRHAQPPLSHRLLALVSEGVEWRLPCDTWWRLTGRAVSQHTQEGMIAPADRTYPEGRSSEVYHESPCPSASRTASTSSPSLRILAAPSAPVLDPL
jgi:hypothetical protein